MLRALATNLLAHERIETTDAKAKELRRVAERMITRAIRLGPVAYTPHDKLSLADRARRQAAQRQMARFLRRFAVVIANAEPKKVDVVEKVFVDLARRFKDRPGGYTRIIKVGRRRGDNAPMSIIELVVRGESDEKKAKPAEPAAKTATKAAKKSESAEAPEAAATEPETSKKSSKGAAAEAKPSKSGKSAEKSKAEPAADKSKAEPAADKSKAEPAADKPAAKKPRRAKAEPGTEGD
jgi:large subunit ribosomal protein L17